jgi:hypothetical protein
MKLVSDNSKRPPKRTMPCRCGALERHAIEPDSPIRFDTELNEYHFVHRNSKGNEGYLLIRHCPFCGGKAPESRRDLQFRQLSLAEQIRLSKLIGDFHTIDEVIAALGEPDIKDPIGVMATNPERDGKPETTQVYATMTYTSLSDVADIVITVYAPDRLGIQFQGKAVKPKAD